MSKNHYSQRQDTEKFAQWFRTSNRFSNISDTVARPNLGEIGFGSNNQSHGNLEEYYAHWLHVLAQHALHQVGQKQTTSCGDRRHPKVEIHLTGQTNSFQRQSCHNG